MYYREDDAPMQEALAHLVSQEAGKEKYPDITAWTLTGDVLVQNRELGRKKQAECMSVYGSSGYGGFAAPGQMGPMAADRPGGLRHQQGLARNCRFCGSVRPTGMVP